MDLANIGRRSETPVKPPSVTIFPGSVHTSIAINNGVPILFMSGLGDDQKMYLWSSEKAVWKLAVKETAP